MNYTAQAPQPSLAWQFESSNVDSVTSLAPTSTGGTPTYVTGKYGKAINFPNSVNTGTVNATNNVFYTVSLNPSVGYTVAFWVNFNFGGVFAQVMLSIANSNGARASNIFINNLNQLVNVNIDGTNITITSPTLTTGTWYHVALSITSSTRVLYLNGIGTSGTSGLSGTQTSFILGGDLPSIGSFSAWCSIDDLRVFNTALTAAQVQAVYNAQGMPSQISSSFYLPTVPGYSYVPFSALPSSFTLTQTSTGNTWTINTSTNQIRDGNWGGDPVLSMTPSQPSDIYSTRNPGIWYRLFGNSNYVRHAGFVMWTTGYASGNFDFAWAFFLQNGTTNQIKIWNPYPGDGVGNWVQSGTYTAGRIAINTQNPALAHVYTISSPVSSTSLKGTPLFSQLSTTATASAVGAFSLRAVNSSTPGGTAKAVNVRPVVAFPPPGMTANGPQTLTGYSFGGTGSYTASSSSASGFQGWQAWAAFDNNTVSFWENQITNTGVTNKQWSGIGVNGVSNTYNTSTVVGPFSTTISGTAYSGEWIQIQFPVGIVLYSYSMYGRYGWSNAPNTRMPYTWYIGGSNDGSTWTLVDSQTGYTNWVNSPTTSSTFTTTNTTAYIYYRMVITAINSGGNGSQELNIGQWSLYGSNASFNTDFYADRLGNLLTAPVTGRPLASWLGGGTGYVTTWYDQSGKGSHMSCSSISIQPKIDTVNKWIDFKTSAWFDTSATPTTGPVPYSNTQNYTIICRHNTIGNSRGGICGVSNAAPNYNTTNYTNNFRGTGGGYQNYWYGNDVNGGTYAAGNSVSFKWDGTNRYIYSNGSLVTTVASSNWWQTSSSTQMIGKTTNDVTMNGEMYYLFMFNTALSDADRQLVEALPIS